MPLAQLFPYFLSLPSLPTSGLCHFRCWFPGEWVYVCSRTLWASLCETGSFSHCCTPHKFLQQEVFESLVSYTETLGDVVCLALQLFLLAYPHMNVHLPAQPATPLPHLVLQPLYCQESSLPYLPISAPPTSLDVCFFNSLVVGLPRSLISWQFWLFLFLNWLSFFWICQEAKCSTYASILARTPKTSEPFFFGIIL